VLDRAVAAANERLIEAGEVPLPEGLTPHKLRHTFASILVMDQIGHTDAGFTLRVYRHGMRRDRAAKDRLQRLVGGAQWTAADSSHVHAPWSEHVQDVQAPLASAR
jgi:integrase